MKISTKAAILSAIVFPGAGHIYLKKYLSGTVFTLLSLTAIVYLISSAIEKALQIVEKIQNGQLSPDILSITELLSKQATGTDTIRLNMATTAIFICWVTAIIDSYRAASLRDKSG